MFLSDLASLCTEEFPSVGLTSCLSNRKFGSDGMVYQQTGPDNTATMSGWRLEVRNNFTQRCCVVWANSPEECITKMRGNLSSGRGIIEYGLKKAPPPVPVASKDGSWVPLFNW